MDGCGPPGADTPRLIHVEHLDLENVAGAAVASVHHRQHGDCLVVVRAANDTAVLPRADAVAGERLQETAIDALCSSTGTISLRWTVKPGVSVGHWSDGTGSGVEGFAVRVSDLFAQMAGLEVSFLPWRQLADASLGDEAGTPTLSVTDPLTGSLLTLRGADAGLVDKWRHRVMPGG